MRLDAPILALALGQTVVWAALYYVFPALVLAWEADLGWSRAAIMGAFTGALAVWALAAPAIGGLIDRRLGPVIAPAAAVLGGLALIAVSFTRDVVVFYALWLIIGGVYAACLYDAAFAMVTRARGAAARPAITAITLVAGFAGTLSFPLGNAVTAAAGWPAAAQLFGAAAILLGAPLLRWSLLHLEAETAAAEAQTPAAAPPPGLLTSPAFWLTAIAFATVTLHSGIMVSHILPLLADRGVPAALSVTAAASIGPMQVAGRLALLSAGARVGNRTILLAVFATLVASLAFAAVAGRGLALLAAFVVLHGAGYGLYSIARPVVTREILGHANFGRISGRVIVPSLVALAAAPSIGAALWQAGGYDLVLATLALTSTLGLVATLAAYRASASLESFQKP